MSANPCNLTDPPEPCPWPMVLTTSFRNQVPSGRTEAGSPVCTTQTLGAWETSGQGPYPFFELYFMLYKMMCGFQTGFHRGSVGARDRGTQTVAQSPPLSNVC